MKVDLIRRTSVMRLAWLAVLPICPCLAQSYDFSAEPASMQATLAGVAVKRSFPRVPPPISSLNTLAQAPDAPHGDNERKYTRFANAPALSAAQQSSSVPPPPSTVANLQSFFPPQAYDESSCGGWRIANGGLAASTSYLVEAGTACVKILNPNTGAVVVGPTTLGEFFGSSNNTASARALYDPVSSRFLVSAEDYSNNEIYLAASQTSDPTGVWNIYSFPMMESCSSADNPKLGQTYQEAGDSLGAIYLTWDVYCPPNGPSNFAGAISKTLAYSGAPIPAIDGFQGLSIDGAYVDFVQPANVINSGDHPRGEFLLNSFNWHFGGGSCVQGCNGIVVWDFFNGIPASGSQSITAVVVPTANTYYLSPNAPQPGCPVGSCGPAVGEPVMGGEVAYSAGSLFGALNDNMGILAVELEPEVNDSGAIIGAILRNEICFACGGFSNGGQAYNGAIQPDSERNWLMVFNYSAPGPAGCTPNPTTCIYPSTAFVIRRVSQAQNTFYSTGSILALGQGYYSQFNPAGQNRWTDYSAVGTNYAIPNSFWFDNEYSEATGKWGTVIGQNGYTSPTQP